MKNRVTCNNCERCIQCFEEDCKLEIRQNIKESWEDFLNKTACTMYFKEKDEH